MKNQTSEYMKADTMLVEYCRVSQTQGDSRLQMRAMDKWRPKWWSHTEAEPD